MLFLLAGYFLLLFVNLCFQFRDLPVQRDNGSLRLLQGAHLGFRFTTFSNPPSNRLVRPRVVTDLIQLHLDFNQALTGFGSNGLRLQCVFNHFQPWSPFRLPRLVLRFQHIQSTGELGNCLILGPRHCFSL